MESCSAVALNSSEVSVGPNGNKDSSSGSPGLNVSKTEAPPFVAVARPLILEAGNPCKSDAAHVTGEVKPNVAVPNLDPCSAVNSSFAPPQRGVPPGHPGPVQKDRPFAALAESPHVPSAASRIGENKPENADSNPGPCSAVHSSEAPPSGGVPMHRSKSNSVPSHHRSSKASKAQCSNSMPAPEVDTASFDQFAKQSLTYPKWCAELTSNVLRSKTPYAAYLKRTIQLSRSSRSSRRTTPSFFPIPLPNFGIFGRMTFNSSASVRHTVHELRALHVITSAFNYWYSQGRHGDMELLRREPSHCHRTFFDRVRILLRADSQVRVDNLPKAGRRFPELIARLSELTDVLAALGPRANPYDKSLSETAVPKNDAADDALKPYHDLDPEKIVLHGKGAWDPTPFLSDEICMAFRDPKLLLHGREAEKGPTIRDSPDTVATLASKWDQLGLLRIHRDEMHPDSLVRIFGARKDEKVHRQIGDRRGQNARECKVLGPSSSLPNGTDFCELHLDPRSESLRISITDRKDFYHQLRATRAKAILNTVGPSVSAESVNQTKAYSEFILLDCKQKYSRLKHGDRLSKTAGEAALPLDEKDVYVSFSSILQGDHAGVEIATDSHGSMLSSYGLLDDESRMVASRPLRATKLAQGLVIDDFFAVSIEPRSQPQEASKAYDLYHKAQAAYGDHELLGSPTKDVIAQSQAKVIGAYVNAHEDLLDQGVALVSSPPEKKLAMSHLSLVLAQQKFTTDSLHLCLIGGWVSILGYRRPMMGLLNHAFHLVSGEKYDKNHPSLLPLSRKVADELVLVAVLMPFACCDIAAPFSLEAFCTDASNSKGAVLKTTLHPAVAEVLWRTSRSKGAYSRLLSPIESMLQRLGALEERDKKEPETIERPLAFSFEFLEIFSGASKITGFLSSRNIVCGPPIDLDFSEELDMRQVHVISWVTHLVQQKRLLGFFLSPPCTTFSIMRRPRLRSKQKPLGFDVTDAQTCLGTTLAMRALQVMYIGAQNDSCGILETPHSAYTKHLPAWQTVKSLPDCSEVRVDSCRFGSPHLKSFRFLGLRTDMTELNLRCICQEKHLLVQGVYTKASATYTDPLADCISKCLAEAINARKQVLLSEDEIEVKGLESQFANEVMQSSRWELCRVWKFRKASHINILEESSLLRLCNMLARGPTPIRTSALVDSNVVRCATAKGRTASKGLGPVLRRVNAICTACGLYLHIPFTPTRLNVADDPTRDRQPREPSSRLNLHEWSRDDLFDLAKIPKLKRWASNWVRLCLLIGGRAMLNLSDRNLFRQGNVLPSRTKTNLSHDSLEFDSTLGFPGEGPPPCTILWISSLILFVLFQELVSSQLGSFHSVGASPGRWNLHTRASLCSRHLVSLGLSSPSLLRVSVFAGVLGGESRGAMATPIFAKTPGEKLKAQLRSQRAPLVAGRQVTDATVKTRERFWQVFIDWTVSAGIDFQYMMDNHQNCIDELNFVMVRYGRLLYDSGKSYMQYAETLNSLGSRKPAVRRLLQQSWDLGYAWVRSEPSTHHVAMPPAVLVAMMTVALMWGWVRVAGCLGLAFNALLRPGELFGALRQDLLLPSDLDGSVGFALLSIKEPKSRFTQARHQTGKADSSDILRVLELAFGTLNETERLWNLGPQSLRNRFKSLLGALHLPIESTSALRALDLGSLRSGGATFIIQSTESVELCRRRGRWANMKMMDIYVQETMALQYMKLIAPASRRFVLDVARLFTHVLNRTIQFQQAHIPTHVWYRLHLSERRLES